jgi:hypothetical protein
MAVRLFPLLMVSALALTLLPAASAEHDPSPTVGDWVEAEFRLAHESLTRIQLTGTLDVRQYVEDGDVYSADDVRNSYSGANRFGKSTGDAFITSIEASIRTQLGQTLEAAFPSATTRSVTQVQVVRSTLTSGAGGDEFDPPVRVNIAATIERSFERLGLGSYDQAAVDAAFDAGAVVGADFTLSARPGYEMTYVMTPPPGLVFLPNGDGDVSADGRTLTIVRDNTRGTTTLRDPVEALLDDPASDAPSAERVDSTTDIRLGEIVEGASGIPVTTDFALSIHAISIAERFPTALPPKVRLTHVNADGLRGLYQSGAITDAILADAEASLRDSLRENLSASMGSDVVVTGGFLKSTLETPPARPYRDANAVRFEAKGLGEQPFEGPASENIGLAFDLGAAISMDLDFAAGSGTSTYVVHAPPGITFEEAEGGTLAEDGASIRFVSTAASAGAPASLTMRSDDAPRYTAADASLGIVVDLKDLDIKLGEAVGGDFGDLVIDVTVLGNLGVIQVPEDLRSSMDPRVSLEFLSSDGIRLLRDRGLLDDANFSALEDQMLDEMAKGLRSALGQAVRVEGGFVPSSLDVGLVSDPPSGENPVVFRATASLRQSLSGDAAANAQAAIALYTTTQSFDLPRVQGLETTYTVILPKGLALQSVSAPGAESSTGTSEDGRDQFTVKPTGESSKATVSMAVTPTFIFAKFLPLVILVVVVLLLLVGTPIALVVRGRGKGKA